MGRHILDKERIRKGFTDGEKGMSKGREREAQTEPENSLFLFIKQYFPFGFLL